MIGSGHRRSTEQPKSQSQAVIDDLRQRVLAAFVPAAMLDQALARAETLLRAFGIARASGRFGELMRLVSDDSPSTEAASAGPRIQRTPNSDTRSALRALAARCHRLGARSRWVDDRGLARTRTTSVGLPDLAVESSSNSSPTISISTGPLSCRGTPPRSARADPHLEWKSNKARGTHGIIL